MCKPHVRRLWNDMMATHVQSAPSRSGQVGREHLRKLVDCVHTAWDAVPAQVTRNDFAKASA